MKMIIKGSSVCSRTGGLGQAQNELPPSFTEAIERTHGNAEAAVVKPPKAA